MRPGTADTRPDQTSGGRLIDWRCLRALHSLHGCSEPRTLRRRACLTRPAISWRSTSAVTASSTVMLSSGGTGKSFRGGGKLLVAATLAFHTQHLTEFKRV